MNNLSYYQKRVSDKILPPLGKVDSFQEINRICKFYRESIEKEQVPYIIQEFKKGIESNLHKLLQSKPKFYNFGYFEDNYKVLINDFIEENIDGDENDFIEEYINTQQEIIDKTFKYYIKVEGYESLEVTQFVQKDFFDEFILGSKKKIKFLNSLSTVKENAKEINYDNPYPDFFNSYGYEIYKDFTSTIKKEIILAEMSFLVDQLKKDGLMNSDKTLKSIFNFMVKEFDTNFGTATKFKSDYSIKNHLVLYEEIKKRYDIVSL
tara:strand:+ start:2741 stop:3532 length:792 start_codon:yes stop_codon:yes gene_type:complete